MKSSYFAFFTACVLLSSCASTTSIPQETVALTKLMSNDLRILHQNHKELVTLYYDQVIADVNAFVDDVYAPHLIDQLVQQKESKEHTPQETKQFLLQVRKEVEAKRMLLVGPLQNQREEMLADIDKSYYNVLYANASVSGHLQSLRNTKESHKEALSNLGLKGKVEQQNNTVKEVALRVKAALNKAKQIDMKGQQAKVELERISQEIQAVTK